MRLKPFKNYYINVSRKIDELSNGFSDLSILKRIDLIFSLVRLLNGKGNSVDLSDLYLVSTGVSKGSRTGVTTEKTKIDSTAIVKLVTKSISGFFENVTVMNL